jgi:prephenate dehydrogenase
MSLNLTVIGLDRLGTSIGLALNGKNADIHRIGVDLDRKLVDHVKEMGAFDQLETNLSKAVQLADVVLISLPFDQVEITLKTIAQVIKQEVVLAYCSTLPSQVAALVKDLFPDRTYFIAMTPAYNAKYLEEADQHTPHADLFENGVIMISHPPQLPSAVIQTIIDLTKALGAKPYFADLLEVDGFQSITEVLPQIASTAVLLSAAGEPGWKDAGKLANYLFYLASKPLDNLMDSDQPGHSLIVNRENSLRMIDNLQVTLQTIRKLIETRDKVGLKELLLDLQTQREMWLKQRLSGGQEKSTGTKK